MKSAKLGLLITGKVSREHFLSCSFIDNQCILIVKVHISCGCVLGLVSVSYNRDMVVAACAMHLCFFSISSLCYKITLISGWLIICFFYVGKDKPLHALGMIVESRSQTKVQLVAHIPQSSQYKPQRTSVSHVNYIVLTGDTSPGDRSIISRRRCAARAIDNISRFAKQLRNSNGDG